MIPLFIAIWLFNWNTQGFERWPLNFGVDGMFFTFYWDGMFLSFLAQEGLGNQFSPDYATLLVLFVRFSRLYSNHFASQKGPYYHAICPLTRYGFPSN